LIVPLFSGIIASIEVATVAHAEVSAMMQTRVLLTPGFFVPVMMTDD